MTFTQKQIDNMKIFRNEQGEFNIPEIRDTILRLIIDDNLTNQEIKQLKAYLQILIAFMMIKKNYLNNINMRILSFTTKFSDRTIH